MKDKRGFEKSDKKTVMLIVAEYDPVPAVQGGSVSFLVTKLLEQNEKYNKVRFVVTAKYNEEAAKIKYKNSEIYYNRNGWLNHDSIINHKNIWKFYLLAQRVRRKLFYNKITNKLTGKYLCYDPMMLQCLHIAKKEHAGVMVLEDLYQLRTYIPVINFVGKENAFFHLHFHLKECKKERIVIPNSILISEFVKKEWVKDNDIIGKNEVLYNCIDIEKYNVQITDKERLRRRSELKIELGDFAVVYCGRFIPEKGVEQLLDAFDVLHDKQNIKLILIGYYAKSRISTDFSRSIVERAAKMDNVIPLGFIPNEKVIDYYLISDAMVIPSVWQEGAGLVAIEGMAAGLPLIITDSGGMVEYVDNDCAVKVPIDDELSQNLAAKIIELSKDAHRCKTMGKAGKKRAQLFTPEKYYQNYIRIVSEGE